MNQTRQVTAALETAAIPTYGLGKPEKNPLFFQRRVYQGSCGKVYPVPFVDKVFQDDPPRPVVYRTARLENEFVRLVMLPEIGGRIFLGQDKCNGDYDFFYRQDVIKPALVGLAGPWISGGVEFNWPQHHRPGTYLPADVTIEQEENGACTVWLSEHDPLNRLKGMHGIRLRPDSALVELRVRLYNRTALTQTFLWWANVAARVHDRYQSFFPPDVHYVADHAVRAISSFPAAEGVYYGIDYSARPGANDLTWYRNIPVPTSYMVCETQFDFFGGYDHAAKGGFVHVADRHIAPGKKQWTWGNEEFGRAWDRELTDANGPYVELMAGVYTDNQPDFAYLLPYETRCFSQFWWPYRNLGPVQQANRDAAVRMVVDETGAVELGLAVASQHEGLRVVLRHSDRVLLDETVSASPAKPWQHHRPRLAGDQPEALELRVHTADRKLLIAYRPVTVDMPRQRRQVANVPPSPDEILSNDELYFTGEHLAQYRHPTRFPEAYWEEAIRRDAGDARCRIGLARRALARGRFDAAAEHLDAAIGRLTSRHPNPVTGEAHYYLGLTHRFQARFDEAYPLFYKATWNGEWRAAAYYELTCIDLRRGNVDTALAHLQAALAANTANNKACVLRAICLATRGRLEEARAELASLLAVDPLDHWALAECTRLETGEAVLHELSRNDAQTALDVAFDYADAGCFAAAASVLIQHHRNPVIPVAVPNPLERCQLTHYALAWLYDRQGLTDQAAEQLAAARRQSPDHCFPSRLHEQIVLEWALQQPGPDRNAGFGLGNLYYDRQRYDDAVTAWEQARAADESFATVHRNLGIAYWNGRHDGPAASASYERALTCDPRDARLVFEYDQLRGKLGETAEARLAFLEGRRQLVLQRDDATVALASLYNRTGQPRQALDLLRGRTFHPWEGGEGKVLGQYKTARIALGREALAAGDADAAWHHFSEALQPPDNLGEQYHPLQARADVYFWQGMALRARGRHEEAVEHFTAAAAESGDFLEMAVATFSEQTYYQGLSLSELGRKDEARRLFAAMKRYAEQEIETPADIDYFATSLPDLLMFDEDLDAAKRARMARLLDLAKAGLATLGD